MKLAVGGDHAGFPLKGPLVAWLQAVALGAQALPWLPHSTKASARIT